MEQLKLYNSRDLLNTDKIMFTTDSQGYITVSFVDLILFYYLLYYLLYYYLFHYFIHYFYLLLYIY